MYLIDVLCLRPLFASFLPLTNNIHVYTLSPSLRLLLFHYHVILHSNNTALDVVEQYATYEDYLDAQVTETDMYFLQVGR